MLVVVWRALEERGTPWDAPAVRLVVATLVLAAQLGCGGGCSPSIPEPSTECDTSIPAPAAETVVAGQLDDRGAFVPLTDGDHLPLHFGSQGGSHLELAVRLYAEAGDVWVHELALWNDDLEEQAGSTSERVEACTPGWSVTSGVLLIFWGGGVGTSTGAPWRLELASRRYDTPEHVVASTPILIGIE